MRYRRIKWLLALLLATIVCHAQVSIDLTENTDGTWTLAAMPAYNVSMVVEYEDDLSQVIGEFTENPDGTWTLDAMPASNVKMIVEYTGNGDANNDSKVTITDAVAIVNKILGNESAGFNETAADVNGDGDITITDAVGVVNIILNNEE